MPAAAAPREPSQPSPPKEAGSAPSGPSSSHRSVEKAELANIFHEAALQKLQQGLFEEGAGFLKKALTLSFPENPESFLTENDEDDDSTLATGSSAAARSGSPDAEDAADESSDSADERTAIKGDAKGPQKKKDRTGKTGRSKEKTGAARTDSAGQKQATSSKALTDEDAAQTAFILGMVQLNNLGNWKEAEIALRLSLTLREKCFGTANPATIVTKGSLAQCLEKQERV